MNAIWMRARNELRTRWRAWVGLALVMGLAGGVVVAAVAGARRTDRAYPEFRVAQNTAQAGVANAPELFGFAHVDLEKAEAFPEVVESARLFFDTAFIQTPRGDLLTPLGDQNPLVLFGSTDGRFDHGINRMRFIDGGDANPNDPDEIVVSYQASQAYKIRTGDILLARFPTGADFAAIGSGGPVELHGPQRNLRVTGIELTSWELPPGNGYPTIHLTPAFMKRFGPQTLAFPAEVFRLRADADSPRFLARLQSDAIVPGSASTRVQYFDETANARSVTSGIHAQAIALGLLALVAGLVSLLVFAQAIARQTSLETTEHGALRALGMTRRDLFAIAMVRALVMGGVAAGAAVALAWILSPLSPTGLARLLVPNPGMRFDAAALSIGAACIFGAVLVLSVGPALIYSRARLASAVPVQRASRIVESVARSGFPPPAVAGVRMALETGRGRTAVPVRSAMLGAITGIAAIVLAFGFGSSMDNLLQTPRLIGWNWSGTVGDDFDVDDSASVIPALRDDRDIAAFSAGGDELIRIKGTSIPAVGMDPIQGRIHPAIIRGRPPESVDEIALSSRTSRRFHIALGDLIAVSVGARTQSMRVVGTTIIPPTTFQNESGSAAWMTFQAMRRLSPRVAQDVYLFRYAAGVDRTAAHARLKETFPAIQVSDAPDFGDVANLRRVQRMPYVLAGILALFAIATVTHSLLSSVRRRRADLAILKTLGFVRRQVRAAVAWHASSFIVVALLFGIPLGLLGARWAWAVFADQISVIDEPRVRALPILLIVPAGLLVVNVLALLPGRAASRTRPAQELRSGE